MASQEGADLEEGKSIKAIHFSLDVDDETEFGDQNKDIA